MYMRMYRLSTKRFQAKHKLCDA